METVFTAKKYALIEFSRPKTSLHSSFFMQLYNGDSFVFNTTSNDLTINRKRLNTKKVYHYESDELNEVMKFFNEGIEDGFFIKE